MAGSLAAYSVYVGGDAWEWARLANRYLTPAGVSLLILAAVAVEPLADRLRASRRPVFGVAVVVIVGLSFVLADSWIGVLLHGSIGDYLGVTPTDSDQAALAVVVLAVVVLAVAWFAGARRKLPARWARPLAGRADRRGAAPRGVRTARGRRGSATAASTRPRTGARRSTASSCSELTDPGATIAVIWAGAPIYYAHRDGVDLLGKMDPVIAHGPHHPGVPMYPGHDKFDFDHSVGVLRPDLIAQYAWFTDADIDRFLAEGYTPMRLRPGVADELVGLRGPARPAVGPRRLDHGASREARADADRRGQGHQRRGCAHQPELTPVRRWLSVIPVVSDVVVRKGLGHGRRNAGRRGT